MICITVPRTGRPAIWTRKVTDGNEGTDEDKIEEHHEPTKPFWSATAQETHEQRSEEGVQDGDGENAFYGSGSTIDTALSLDGVDESMDFVDAGGEDGE